MKKMLIILLISSAAYSQNITDSKATVTRLLCKTWKANDAMMNGLKVQNMGQMKSLEFTFTADGNYLGNKIIKDKWKFNAKKKCIELYEKGVLKSTITTLQSKKIVMVLNADKSAPKNVTQLEIYFKPKV